jgi:hypothetical protein
VDYLSLKMTSNEKSLNIKIVDLVEGYNFDIKFISIWVYTKKLWFSENELRRLVLYDEARISAPFDGEMISVNTR